MTQRRAAGAVEYSSIIIYDRLSARIENKRDGGMSYSKRILFGNDPADDSIRAQLQARTEALLKPFTFKIPTRRKNPAPGPHWDPRWRWAVHRAIGELAIETVNINDQVCAQSKAEANSIKARAETLYQEALQKDILSLAS